MRLAIVADWLVTFGGAEHVLAELVSLFPDSPVYTTVARRRQLGPFAQADIRVSRLQRWYRFTHQHQVLLPWMPQAIESLDLSGFDVVLSSSHAVAKGVIPRPGTLHLCYCHTPMRYAWEMEEQYLDDFGIPRFLRGPVRRQLSHLRRWDLTTSKRVDVFIANSSTTQERIERTYGRDSVIIPPPVDARFFEAPVNPAESERYFLAVGRLVPYKRFDLLIEAANALRLPLKIAGKGQDEARLRAMAGPTVRFLGFVPDEDLPSLYADAEALLFPQIEDAGIVLLEALACGTPVIALRAGGARDVVEDGVNGIFFEEQTSASVREALERFGKKTWDRSVIRESARPFSQEKFRERIQSFVEEEWRTFSAARMRGLAVAERSSA